MSVLIRISDMIVRIAAPMSVIFVSMFVMYMSASLRAAIERFDLQLMIS